jgi:cell division protein FtsL
VQTTVYEVSTKFKELETKVEKKKRDAAAINNEMGVFSPKTVSF